MKPQTQLILGLLTSLGLATLIGCSKPALETGTLEGRWSGFEQGRPDTKITLTFDKGTFAYWSAKSNEWGSGTFLVNDTIQPSQIDLTFEQCVAPEYINQVSLAIYELRGDELRFAGAEPGSTVRPTNLNGGDGIRAFTFKRE